MLPTTLPSTLTTQCITWVFTYASYSQNGNKQHVFICLFCMCVWAGMYICMYASDTQNLKENIGFHRTGVTEDCEPCNKCWELKFPSSAGTASALKCWAVYQTLLIKTRDNRNLLFLTLSYGRLPADEAATLPTTCGWAIPRKAVADAEELIETLNSTYKFTLYLVCPSLHFIEPQSTGKCRILIWIVQHNFHRSFILAASICKLNLPLRSTIG